MIATEITFLVVSLFVSGSLCSIQFKYTDCNSSPRKVGHVDSVHLQPYPVMIPGDLTVDINVRALQNVSGNYKLELSLYKSALFWIKVPCISGVGSCTYDLCNLLETNFGAGTTGCPAELVQYNLPCKCPFQVGRYVMPQTVFHIPELGGLWSWLASGDYKGDAKIVSESGEEVGCYHVEVSFKSPCHGLGCIFG